VAQKVATTKLSKNVLNRYKSASEITFLRQIKEMIKHYNMHRY